MPTTFSAATSEFWRRQASSMTPEDLSLSLQGKAGPLAPEQEAAYAQELERRRGEGQPQSAPAPIQPQQVVSGALGGGGISLGEQTQALSGQNVLAGVLPGGDTPAQAQAQLQANPPSGSYAAAAAEPQSETAEGFLTRIFGSFDEGLKWMATKSAEVGKRADEWLFEPGVTQAEEDIKKGLRFVGGIPFEVIEGYKSIINPIAEYFGGPLQPERAGLPPEAQGVGPAQLPQFPVEALRGGGAGPGTGIGAGAGQFPVTLPGSQAPDYTQYVPGAPNITQPDFTQVLAALEGAAPTAPETDKDAALLNILLGAAQGAQGGFTNADIILGAGAGSLGGLLKNRAAERERTQEFQRAQQEYQLQRADTLGQIEQARVQGLNAAEQTRYEHASLELQAKFKNFQARQPEVIDADQYGVTYMYTDDSGNRVMDHADTGFFDKYVQSRIMAKGLGSSTAEFDLMGIEKTLDQNDPLYPFQWLTVKGLEAGVLPGALLDAGFSEDNLAELATLPETGFIPTEGESYDKASRDQVFNKLVAILASNPQFRDEVWAQVMGIASGAGF